MYRKHKPKQKSAQKRPYLPQAGIEVNPSNCSVKNGWPVNQDQYARGY